jgi:hypothetical protein
MVVGWHVVNIAPPRVYYSYLQELSHESPNAIAPVEVYCNGFNADAYGSRYLVYLTDDGKNRLSRDRTPEIRPTLPARNQPTTMNHRRTEEQKNRKSHQDSKGIIAALGARIRQLF